MGKIEITRENMDAAYASVPENTPCLLLNLLKYKEQATYGLGEDFEPCSGRDAYFKRYIPVFLKLAASRPEIKPFFFGKVLAGLIPAEDEKWENCALISYPDFKSFRDIIESEAYKTKALPHRLAAIEDYKLMVTVETEPS